jgi:hypothetical protein
MKEAQHQARKKVLNVKNLILNGIHIVVVLIALVAHPVFEMRSVGTLP